MNPKLIDSHTHVQFAAFKNDVDEVIKRALDAGIWIVNVGSQKDTSKEAVTTAEKYPEGVYATVGLHPGHTNKSHYDSDEMDGGESFSTRSEIFDYGYYKDLANHPKVVAIGECGLDYYRMEESESDAKEKQKIAFIQHIELANEIKKPLMIHCREAFPDLIDTLKANHSNLLAIPGIIHFFSGTKFEATELLDMGFYFTFGGVITFSRDYDEIIKTIPISRILLETDAPYVTPEPYRGKRNEPLYVQEVAKKMAEIRGVDLEEIAHHTNENARSIFGI
jgi:TatD DNase family protein